jgi:hypothetical protein
MSFRFTIRDLLWFTLVVAMLIGWWLDQRVMNWHYEHDHHAIDYLDARRPETWTIQQTGGSTVITNETTKKTYTLKDGNSFRILQYPALKEE